MDYSKRFEEDYSFYYRNKNKYNFCGKDVIKDFVITEGPGMDAKECFYRYDSHGEREFTCPNKEELVSLIICKASINLHMKMYAEGYAEYTLLRSELEEIVKNIGAPKWFMDGIEKQANKIRSKNKDSWMHKEPEADCMTVEEFAEHFEARKVAYYETRKEINSQSKD